MQRFKEDCEVIGEYIRIGDVDIVGGRVSDRATGIGKDTSRATLYVVCKHTYK